MNAAPIASDIVNGSLVANANPKEILTFINAPTTNPQISPSLSIRLIGLFVQYAYRFKLLWSSLTPRLLILSELINLPTLES